MSVDHYENFPVASWLCPRHLRPAVKALYWFARTADDLADEGNAAPAHRLAQLFSYRQALALALADQPDPEERWPQVFGPLRATLQRHRLDPHLLQDLLSAFEQDVHNPHYQDRAELLDYCRRSANPVGRLLLQLYGVSDPVALRQSDAICTALQLINFWQDIGRDLAKGRCYVPRTDAQRHAVDPAHLQPGMDTPATRALLRDLCHWSERLMLEGAALVHRVPGRAGWELRLVVQGGLRVLERIGRMHHATLLHRPTLSAWDAPLLLLRAVTMGTGPAARATA
ncbi:squalene synthase HpnC [Ideonella sp. BN130291]|uniref:squalene synthase HpnC n=1 Tax=Ideonella sp. BN130291 TaxID=3112940 RepID=UPI002E256379|nr:squalene synthase HpnC [Ideonella sp. BN130291]